MRDWHAVDQFAVETATTDLTEHKDVRPLLVAFAGDRLRFFAFLRWFPAGGYAAPVIELLSLALPLGANRLAFSAAGRLTSLADPVAPVTAEGDLRQRAVVIESVDGADGDLRQHSTIHPFDLAGDRVVWGEPVRLTGARGWIADALRLSVQRRDELSGVATDDLRAQALRCVALGHDLHLDSPVRARLGLADRARH